MAASSAWIRSSMSPSGTNADKRRVRRVLIVDDHPIVRQGLRRIMENEEDLIVCGEAETARDARTAIKELNPDVMIADLSLKQSDGIELVRDVRAHYPQMPILVLSMHDETIYAERMLSAGANGYIMKQAASELFLLALRRVLDGGIYVSEAVGNNMIQKFAAGGAYISANPIDRLSNRELQILHMIGKGMSTRETAESLNLSIKTVESHRQRIKRKLNLNTGTQLVQYAVNWFTGREGSTATPAASDATPAASDATPAASDATPAASDATPAPSDVP
jgi:DNA-binding NarL/FixJ family response regulator